MLHPWVLPGFVGDGEDPGGQVIKAADRLMETVSRQPGIVAIFAEHQHMNRIRMHRDFLIVDTACLIGYPMGACVTCGLEQHAARLKEPVQKKAGGDGAMKVQWMNHTSFVVRDMEQALAFYRDTLGFVEERNAVIEGERISKLTGFPDARLHAVLLGIGDVRHAIELLQYLNPLGVESETTQLNEIGAAHLGFIVGRSGRFPRGVVGVGYPFRQPAGHHSRRGVPLGEKVVLPPGP